MNERRPSYDDLVDLVQRQQRQIEALQADVARLRAALEEAQRAGKRQAAPFRKGPPNPAPGRPVPRFGWSVVEQPLGLLLQVSGVAPYPRPNEEINEQPAPGRDD